MSIGVFFKILVTFKTLKGFQLIEMSFFYHTFLIALKI